MKAWGAAKPGKVSGKHTHGGPKSTKTSSYGEFKNSNSAEVTMRAMRGSTNQSKESSNYEKKSAGVWQGK